MTVEIWIRQAGSRRQAFYRAADGNAGWRNLSVPMADKALRLGRIPSGQLAGTPVVSRESQTDPLAARRAEFASEATALNHAMDSIAAGSAA